MPVKAPVLWLTVKRGLLSVVLLMAHSPVSTVTSCYPAIQNRSLGQVPWEVSFPTRSRSVLICRVGVCGTERTVST